MNQRLPSTIPTLLCVAAAMTTASGQSHQVVPDQFATTDAIRASHLPGAPGEWRQQIVVGTSHLGAMLGQDIIGLAWRRSAATSTFNGGECELTITISIAPHSPLETSSRFADNIGTSPTQVFHGTVTLPNSPQQPGPAVDWSGDNCIDVPFAAPYRYTGGSLCIDVTGTSSTTASVTWWPVDATFEDITGTVTNLGGGCSMIPGAPTSWAHVEPRSLLAGGHAQMFAHGTPGALAIAAVGQGSAVGTPLTLLGFPSPPQCELHLATIDLLAASFFTPDPVPELAARGGRADLELSIPALPALLGVSLTTQWFDWTQQATSDAIEWTIAPTLPTLDMALVEGHPSEATGLATPHIAPVLRFEFQ